jgi:hypothetical protein
VWPELEKTVSITSKCGIDIDTVLNFLKIDNYKSNFAFERPQAYLRMKKTHFWPHCQRRKAKFDNSEE